MKNHIDILAHLFKWIDGWLTLIDAIICIISLGFICPSICWKYTMWYISFIAEIRKKDELKKYKRLERSYYEKNNFNKNRNAIS